MIVIFGALCGAGLSGWTASRRKGNRLDIAQYATVGAIAGGLVGLLITILVERMLT